MQHRGQIVGRADWMPLVDEPTWRSVIAILEDPARRVAGTNVRKYLGSGIYECAQCGGRLSGFPRPVKRSAGADRREKKAAYRCGDNGCVVRDAASLDDYVQTHLLARLLGSDAAQLLARREPTIDVKGLRAELRAARQLLDKLAAALGQGEMDMQEWRAAAAPARRRLKAAEDGMKDAVKGNPVAELIAAEDPVALWNSPQFGLDRQRAAVEYLMWVRVGRAGRGRQSDGSYFDKASVDIGWKAGAPSAES
jgi:hypothetical protein